MLTRRTCLKFAVVGAMVPRMLAAQIQPQPTVPKRGNAVNLGHPLNRGLSEWWLAVPGVTSGGVSWPGLVRQTVGTLTGISLPATSTSGWNTTNRRGGYGELRLDGTDDWVNAGDTPFTDNLTQFTLSAWIYLASAPPTTTTYSIFSKYDQNGTTGGKQFNFYVTAARLLEAGISADGTADSGFIGGTAAIPLTTWTQVAMTYTGANIFLWMNGVQDATAAYTGGVFATSPQVLCLGKRREDLSFTQELNGRLDDARVQRQALGAQEMRRLYFQSLVGYRDLLTMSALTMFQQAVVQQRRSHGRIF